MKIFKKTINKFYVNLVENSNKRGIYHLLYSFWRKYLKSFDPEIRIKVGNKFLFMNLSHRLPVYYSQFFNYDRALPKICEKIKKIDSRLDVIDIGANIGDTVSLITDVVSGNFLCIEGDKKYLPLLKKNIGQIPTLNHIEIIECYCGSNTNDNLLISRVDGTAKIVKEETTTKNGFSPSKDDIGIIALDTIIDNNSKFKNPNILKIDTDGFEISILNSGKNVLKNAKPLLYFEITPELYETNGEHINTLWKILIECGYKKALFYNNFGEALEIIDIQDKEKLNIIIEKIDSKNIHYYDVLVYHEDTAKYACILDSELRLFTKKTSENNKIKCRICMSDSVKIFDKKIINKYQVDYFHCLKCDFIQTENAYWLDEVYQEPISPNDTGLLARNIYLSKFTTILIALHFESKGVFLDFAGGYGVFTRLMRDIGFNFLWNDLYTVNLFSKGFEWSQHTPPKIELITSFESFEHFVNPTEELEKLLSISDNILFSTELVRQKDIIDWWYLGTHHGQHVSLYSEKTLHFLADKYNLKLYTNKKNLHLFTRTNKKTSIRLIQFLTKFKLHFLVKKILESKTSRDGNINVDNN